MRNTHCWIFEKRGTTCVTTQWTVCAVAMRVTERAYDSVADLLFRAQARLDRAEKGADPRTEQPMHEPSCGNLAELRRAKIWC